MIITDYYNEVIFLFTDRVLLGSQLRKKRKELKKRQEDFADEMVSVATISLIERGLPNVKEEKITYYAMNLGFELEEMPAIADEEEKLERLLLFRLNAMHDLVDQGDSTDALAKLKKMNLKETNPYYPVYLYLIARCKVMRREFPQAQRVLSDAITCIDKYPVVEEMNTKSLCFYDLSKTFFYKNDFRNALAYVEEGIKSFNPKGEKEYLFYSLVISKAIYLDRLDLSEAALTTINELWAQIGKIKNLFVLLNMYETKALILKKQNRYEEAVELAQKGVELARYNQITDRSFDLWVLLGSIYLEENDLEEAEICFLTAVDLKRMVDTEYLFMNLHTQLGRLYILSENFIEAKNALTEAISYQEKTYETRDIISGFYYMGYSIRETEDFRLAMNYYQQALELAKQHGYLKLQHKIYLEMAKCLKHLDEKEFTQCLVNLFEAEVQLVELSG
jgi:tetratricopeptide (TPR) repeat protein